MYGADYAWVLSGAAQDRWWGVTAGTNCSAAQLVESVQGAVLVAAHASITGTHASQSGLTNSQFLQEFSRTGQPLTEYVTQTYDAVWAIALALRQLTDEDEAGGGGQPRSVGHRRHQVQRPAPARREVNSARVNKVTRPPRKPDKEGQECSSGLHQLQGNSTRPTMSWYVPHTYVYCMVQVMGRQHRPEPEQRRQYGYHSHGVYSQHHDAATAAAAFQLDTFDYTREDMADRILETMQGLRFRGVSGPISFDCPDRVGVTAFYQIQDGVPVKVALYHPEAEALDLGCPGCRVLVWPGGEVPASRVFKLRVDTIAPAAFVIMSSLAILGTLLALAFLIFNLTYRRLKYIKLSSPRLNNTTVVGCVLVYAAVVLLGLDHATLPAPNCFPVVCTARAYLLSAGFSLAFGSMFTKTYRVHQIFTRSNSAGVVRNKVSVVTL
ncbi:uncharacterized protein [Panulirus ornatus]|uniref:uncharacterized protein n=1 Tax=Panulirus ornatus TaxID=150431 RepID=UPI003A8779F3